MSSWQCSVWIPIITNKCLVIRRGWILSVIQLTPRNTPAFACLSLSSSCIDFSDYVWRCTHPLDMQTSEHRFLTLCAKHHFTLETEDTQQNCSRARNRPQSYSWVSLIPKQVWVMLQQDSGLSSCEDRKEQKEASDFGVMGHAGETKGTNKKVFRGLILTVLHSPLIWQ